MPSFCGHFFSKEGLKQNLDTMLEPLSYLGDKKSIWEEGPVQLGVVGDDIVSNSEQNYILLFDGERASDEIISLYAEKGLELFSQLTGPFAFAIFDKQKQELILARDRLGEKPLYWTFQNNTFIFSSELKSLLASRSILPYPDFESLSYYFAFGFIPLDRTPVEKVHKLHPGSYLIFTSDGEIITRSYWSLSEEMQEKDEKWQALPYSILSKKILSSCKANSFLARNPNEKHVLKQIPILEFSENPWTTEDFFTHFPKILWHLDEPIADFSIFSLWHLCELAQKNQFSSIAVATGSFAYLSQHVEYPHIKYSRSKHWINEVLKQLLLHSPLTKFRFNFPFRYLRYLHSHPWHTKFLEGQFFNDPVLLKKWIFTGSFYMNLEILLHSYPRIEELGTSLTSLIFLFFRSTLPNQDLLIEDRLTRAFKLQKSAPFLDHRLIEHIGSLPEKHQKRRDDFSLSDVIHPIERPKYKTSLFQRPFQLSIHEFYPYLETIKSGILVQSGLIAKETIETLFSNRNMATFRLLWSIYVLETWFQTFLEPKLE